MYSLPWQTEVIITQVKELKLICWHCQRRSYFRSQKTDLDIEYSTKTITFDLQPHAQWVKPYIKDLTSHASHCSLNSNCTKPSCQCLSANVSCAQLAPSHLLFFTINPKSLSVLKWPRLWGSNVTHHDVFLKFCHCLSQSSSGTKLIGFQATWNREFTNKSMGFGRGKSYIPVCRCSRASLSLFVSAVEKNS